MRLEAGPQIALALHAARLPEGCVEVLSPPDASKRGRAAYRVLLTDGRIVKARVLESAEAAAELVRVRRGIAPAFVPAIAAHDRVLLEAWVEGRPLDDPEEHAAEAGAILGELHRRGGGEIETRRWRERAGLELRRLVEAGELSRRESERIDAALARADPGVTRSALAHRDYCAENMLLAGGLVVIDNEWIAHDAAAFDLARTATRWPMSPAAWSRFLAGYGMDPGPLEFFHIVSTALTAGVRLGGDPRRAAPAIGALRAIG